MAYFEEIDMATPNISGNGQGTNCLRLDPVAGRNRPPAVGVVDASNLVNLEGTDLFQWYGRRSSGYWTPFGEVMRITDEGLQALQNELQSCKEYEVRHIKRLIKNLKAARVAGGQDE